MRLLEWYRVKISLRGQVIRIWLDDHSLFACKDDFAQMGPDGTGPEDRTRDTQPGSPAASVITTGAARLRWDHLRTPMKNVPSGLLMWNFRPLASILPSRRCTGPR